MKHLFKTIILSSLFTLILAACGSGGGSGSSGSNPTNAGSTFTSNIWVGTESSETLIVTKGASPLGGYDIKAKNDLGLISAIGCTLQNPTYMECEKNIITLTYYPADYSITLDYMGIIKTVYYKPGHVPQHNVFTANNWISANGSYTLTVIPDGDAYDINANVDNNGIISIPACKLNSPNSLVCPNNTGTLTYNPLNYSVILNQGSNQYYVYYNPDHLP